jgi:Tol biopolymer transport system component
LNWEIYSARGDGSQQVRLTDDAPSDEQPRLNRGATRLVFASNRSGSYEIYVMNAGGSDLARLTHNSANDADPAWFPDSSRMAFASNRNGNWEIYVIKSDGTSQTRCTSNAADDIAPAWSPDGSQMAWVRRGASGNAIWVMNAACGNPRSVTDPWPYLQNPAWSPDGARLAFDADVDGDGWNELAVINIDGTDLHEVCDADAYLVDAWLGNWSPDGEWLLFSRVEYVIDHGKLYLSRTNIYRVPAAGGTPERLIASGYDLAPDWQTTDVLPPQSRVRALPRFSRVGSVVSWPGADVGPAGKTVTFTIEWRQKQTAPRVQFALDEISLGSWFTSVISDVSPRQAKAWVATPITITGDNLIAIPPSSLYITGPSVSLGAIALPDARWVNTDTLTATVPMTAPPGRYDVWVTNPGGQAGVLQGGLVIGKLTCRLCSRMTCEGHDHPLLCP